MPERVKVSKIFIIGNEKTKKSIILRELNLETDRYYDWETFVEILQADRQKIYNLQLFTQVKITPLTTDSEEVELLISVKERWYILPSIIFRLADRNFSEWWTNQGRDWSRVNYGIKVSHHNVAGRNEKLQFTGQLGFTKQLAFLYSMPYIDKEQKQGLAFYLNYFDQKNVPIRSRYNKQVFFKDKGEAVLRKNLSGAVRYTYRRTFYNSHLLGLGYNYTWASPLLISENENYFQNDDYTLHYVYLKYSFRHDKRNNNSYTTEGELIQLSVTKYGITRMEDLDEVEVGVIANKYFSLGGRTHFATGLSASWFLSPQQPYTLVRGIGYSPNFIRGYELNVIEGQQLYVHKNSLRYKFLDLSFDISRWVKMDQFNTIPFKFYLSGNFDHGYVKDRNYIPENARLTNTYLFGYGLGIDMVGFYDAVFRFEFSRNNQGAGNFFFNFSAPF